MGATMSVAVLVLPPPDTPSLPEHLGSSRQMFSDGLKLPEQYSIYVVYLCMLTFQWVAPL